MYEAKRPNSLDVPVDLNEFAEAVAAMTRLMDGLLCAEGAISKMEYRRQSRLLLATRRSAEANS
jgi:hypothetical protein